MFPTDAAAERHYEATGHREFKIVPGTAPQRADPNDYEREPTNSAYEYDPDDDQAHWG